MVLEHVSWLWCWGGWVSSSRRGWENGGFLGGEVTEGERTQLCRVHKEPHLPHLQTFSTSGATISVFLFRHEYQVLFLTLNSKQATRYGDKSSLTFFGSSAAVVLSNLTNRYRVVSQSQDK